ncbi:hypothetical protein H5203_21555 [Pseudoalteromonas sp. SG41-1]|uniref:hypothetical protein n=1 Tax=Pseudoalteromonas sp. SG41-1 TaxID=2760979 RepID=UPI001601B07D|nr:hypothetical protein [Pseudoalteromonas sp. SG41-1]MBB1508032.1 hypothetical protein [Pseudoalteromonas sp. SG41-1]
MTLRKLLIGEFKLPPMFVNKFIAENKNTFIKDSVAYEKPTGKLRTLLVDDDNKAIKYIEKMPQIRNILLRRKYTSARNVIIDSGSPTTLIHAYLNERCFELKRQCVIDYEKLHRKTYYYCIDKSRLISDFKRYKKNYYKVKEVETLRPYRLIKDIVKVNNSYSYKLFSMLCNDLLKRNLITENKKRVNNVYRVVDKNKFIKYLKATPEYKNINASRKYRSIHNILKTELNVNEDNCYYTLSKSIKDLCGKGIAKIIKVRSKHYYYSLNDIEVINHFKNVIKGVDYDKCG